MKSWHELQADSSERLDDIPWLAPRAKIGPGNNPITVDANGQFESTLLFQQGEYPTWKSWDLTNLTQKWVKTPSSKSRPAGDQKEDREQSRHSGIGENVVPSRWLLCSQAVRATLRTRSKHGCSHGVAGSAGKAKVK